MTPTSSGYLATYQCDNGYNIVGHQERTCDTASDGKWTFSDPTCHGELIIMLEFRWVGEGGRGWPGGWGDWKAEHVNLTRRKLIY